jgi:hypothetical protein
VGTLRLPGRAAISKGEAEKRTAHFFTGGAAGTIALLAWVAGAAGKITPLAWVAGAAGTIAP